MPPLKFRGMSRYNLFIYKKGPLKGNKEPGIYEDDHGRKYIRPRLANGLRPYLSVGTNSITEAIKMRDARKVAKAAATNVAKVIKRSEADSCPTKKGVPRKPGKPLTAEKVRCKILLSYFNSDKPAADLIQNDLDEYKDWRVARVVVRQEAAARHKGKPYEAGPQTGLRTVDLDLNALNNAMRWAVRKTLLKTNPIASRVLSHPSRCRALPELPVANVDELHEVARVLMSSRRSEVLGGQLLYEGMTGLRTEETVGLRLDARQDEAGGVTPDGGTLCVRRAD